MSSRETDLHDAAAALPQIPERLTASLAARAESEALIDVAFAPVESPFGDLLAAVTPRGLCCIAFPEESVDRVLTDLAARISPRVMERPARLDAVTRELDEYFAGKRREFDLEIDWRYASGFGLKVLRQTAKIPFGRVRSYADVARRAGSPRASRAAGNALASNRVPIVVPCHRVVRTGGALGGYGGGLPRKEFLLKLEGAL